MYDFHLVLSAAASPEGIQLARSMEHEPCLELLNTGEPTHVGGGRLDLSIISQELAPKAEWKVHHHIKSDHYAVEINLDVIPVNPRKPTPPRWNTKKANWEKFSRHLEEWHNDYKLPDSLEQAEDDLKAAMTAAADHAIPYTNPNGKMHKNWWYYTDKVKEATRRVNYQRKLHQKRQTPQSKARLAEVSQWAMTVYKEERTSSWLNWCEDLSQYTSVSDLWQKLRGVSGKKRQVEKIHYNPEEEAGRLIKLYADRASTAQHTQKTQELQLALAPERHRQYEEKVLEESPTDRPFNFYELSRAFKKGKDTAAGLDKVAHSMIAKAGPEGQIAIRNLINKSWTEKRLPVTWKHGDIQPIPKPADPQRPRPITLLSCIGKTMERMVLNRMLDQIGPLHPHVFGFQKGVGTVDNILTTLAKASSTSACTIIFIDLEKAFELISKDVIVDLLIKKGVKGNMLGWIADYLTDRQARVRFQGHYSEYEDFENGAPQGGVLIPNLFNLVMDAILSLPYPDGVMAMSYADDLIMIGWGSRTLRHKRIQTSVDLLTDNCPRHCIKVNIPKTKGVERSSKIGEPLPRLYIEGHLIEFVKQHKHLGVIVDDKLSMIPNANYAAEKAMKRVHVMRYMSGLDVGATTEVLKKFYISAVRPHLEYANQVNIIVHEPALKKLEVTQNHALRAILKAPTWCKITNMEMELNIEPQRTRIKLATARYIIRAMAQDRYTGTTIQSMLEAGLPRIRFPKQGKRIQSKSWIAEATDIMNESGVTLEEICQKGADPPWDRPRLPWEQPPGDFRVVKPEGKKSEQAREELLFMATQNITLLETPNSAIYYTDGSVKNDGRSCAGVVTDDNILMYRLTDNCSSMQSELTAIVLALEDADEREAAQIIIHTDSLAAIQALQQHDPKDNRTIITRVQYHIQKAVPKVIINWVPSHVGLQGNEMADEAADHATKLREIDIELKPSSAQLRSLVSAKARSSAYVDQRDQMINSPSNQWHVVATLQKVQTWPKRIPRRAQVAIHRLRLGYPANWEEKSMNKGPNMARMCKHCSKKTAVALIHYLLECPKTKGLRLMEEAEEDPENDVETRFTAAGIVHRACTMHLDLLIRTVLEYPPPR